MDRRRDTGRAGEVTDLDTLIKRQSDWDGPAQNALNKMARAEKRGTGCHLTAEEIRSLAITFIGEVWMEPDPRVPEPKQ